MNAPKPKSLVDEFYANPTPAGAVALAAADHIAAHQFPMWEFVGELRKAKTQTEAYPRLVKALQEQVAIAEAKYAGRLLEEKIGSARALLRELGEPTS